MALKIYRRPMFFHAASYSRDHLAYRSGGLHVMEIVEDMAVQLGHEKRHDPDSYEPTTRESWLLGGFTWERALARELIEHEFALTPGRLTHPGEHFWCYTCNKVLTGGSPESPAAEHINSTGHMGIFLTPDAIDGGDNLLEEWKWTWKSQKRCVTVGGDDPDGMEEEDWTDGDGDPIWVRDETMVEGLWKWPVQALCYARLWWLKRARFRVVFVNGDYGAKVPRPWVFEMEWGRRELRRTWDDVVDWAITHEMLR